MENLIQTIAVYALPVLFAITLHEAAHGYVARRFGDNTAEVLGRISLNPIKHIDPIGTIAVPLLILLTSSLAGMGFLFGWAKPVPINSRHLKNPRKDMVWIAAAGPGINLLMALAWALLAKLLLLLGAEEEFFFLKMADAGIMVNVGLMAINLLPLPPLDGGRIAVGLLPNRLAAMLARIEPYGFFIIIGLMLTKTLSFFLMPFYIFAYGLINLIFN